MQSFENNLTFPTKRPGVKLNIDTGYESKGKGKDVSPPQTPAAQISRPGRSNIGVQNRALKVRNSPRETFLSDITPTDPASNKENLSGMRPELRDSHDLSLSPRQITRDSLVDHMLLSLDQFSIDHEAERQPTVDEERLYPSLPDEEPYQTLQNFAAPRIGRTGHNPSYSSDYENRDDSNSSQYSGHLSKGRRSNSSSNFQSTINRRNSVRKDSVPSSTFNTRSPVQVPPRGIHSRSGKGSKGSSANSFDLGYAQVTSSQRLAYGLAGRSSSFDYDDRESAHSNAMMRPGNASATTFTSYDYDAAPTPTVPVGPRRPRPASPILYSQQELPPAAPVQHPLERKRSTRSSKSAYKSKASGGLAGGRVDYGLHDQTRELPPMPAFLKEQPAPAPLVGYGKSKDSQPMSQPTSQPPKEKPGFFRRVFGSSRNNAVASLDPPRSHGSTTSAETTERPGSTPYHIASQIKSQHVPPPPREPPPIPKEHTHVLTKKPSSFFRRRKKSISEPQRPVPPPIVPSSHLQREQQNSKDLPLPSPGSSLRKAMNPYLKSPGKSPLDQQQKTADSPGSVEAEEYRNFRGFSPDYERYPIATIRTVKPGLGVAKESEQSSRSTPIKAHVSRNREYLGDDRDPTFLQDSSDNDRDAHSANSMTMNVPSRDSPTTWLGSVPPPSPSVARDMALVAEYERVYSKRSPRPARAEVARSSSAKDAPRSPVGSKSSQIKKSTSVKDAEWVMLTPTKLPDEIEKDTENRIWLEPSSSEEDLKSLRLLLPNQGAENPGRTSGSTETEYKSATSLPTLQVDGEDEDDKITGSEAHKELDHFVDASIILDDDRERAQKIYDGNEDFIQKGKAAAWIGEEGPIRSRTLNAYMELYDFSNINILTALRNMCNRLVLKAESQQVDRILDVFAQRWCQSNPNHGFKVTGKPHILLYPDICL